MTVNSVYSGTITIVAGSPTTPTLTASNTLIDQGQSILFTASFSSGTSPYTYNYQIVNSITGATIANQLYTGVVGTSNTYFCTPQANLYTSNTFKANVIVTDASPTTVNSVYSAIGYNSIAALSISASNTILDSGQYTTFTLSESGGTGPKFNTELYNMTGLSQVQSNVLITSVGGSNTISFNVFSTTSSNVFVFSGNSYDEGTATPFSFQTSPVVNTITGVSGAYGIAMTPDGKIVYVSSNVGGTINVINTATNTVIKTINIGSSIQLVAINPSGTLAYVTWGASSLSVINIATNTVINTIALSTGDPSGIAFTPDGTLAYLTFEGDSPSAINVINVATNTVINTIKVGSAPQSVAITPDGTLAYVPNSGQSTVNIINVATNTVINTITVGSSPRVVAFNPSGTLAYVTNLNSGTVSVINIATNTVINTITVGASPFGVAFTPSGNLAYVTNIGSDTVNVINVATNTVITTFTVPGSPRLTAFTPNGQLAYITIYDSGTVSVINTAFAITVNPALATPTISPSSATTYDNGQSITVATYETGGDAPYTYNFLVFNSVTNVLIANQLGTTNSFTFTANAAMVGNTYYANVLVEDSASTNAFANSSRWQSTFFFFSSLLGSGCVLLVLPIPRAGVLITRSSETESSGFWMTFKYEFMSLISARS